MNFLRSFLDRWAYENFCKNFFELVPQRGMNKRMTPITFSLFNISLNYNLTP